MKFDVPYSVINKLFDAGYEEQIIDTVMAFENDSEREVSDIPVSPYLLGNNDEHIILSSRVFDAYNTLTNRIKNPDSAEEIPFFLLGNTQVIDGKPYIVMKDIIYSLEGDFNDFSASHDTEKFKSLVSSAKYDVISIGHTHGNIEESKKETTLTYNMPLDLKKKYKIRDVGLNISIADIWSHEAFKEIASTLGKKRILQTIIMYNGDIVVISDKSISKSTSVSAVFENETINLSTASDESFDISM